MRAWHSIPTYHGQHFFVFRDVSIERQALLLSPCFGVAFRWQKDADFANPLLFLLPRLMQVCVRDLNKKRSFELEKHTTMVTDYDGEIQKYSNAEICRLVLRAACMIVFVRVLAVGRPGR